MCVGDGCACVKTERGPLVVVRDEKTVAASTRSFLTRFHNFFLKKTSRNHQCKFFSKVCKKDFFKVWVLLASSFSSPQLTVTL